jgi:hypothetical protein
VSRGCSGGFFARMRAKHAARRAARNCCGVPTTCCGPAPVAVASCCGNGGGVVYGDVQVIEGGSPSDAVPVAPAAGDGI